MVLPVLAAADFSGAEYEGGIRVSNAGTAITGCSVYLEMNTDTFQDEGYLETDYCNIGFATGSDAPLAFMPIPAAVNPSGKWAFFYPYSLPASSQTNCKVYMGGPDMTAPLYYIPASGGMTASDTASLELGNNFAIEQLQLGHDLSAVDTALVAEQLALIVAKIGEEVPGKPVASTTVRRNFNHMPVFRSRDTASGYETHAHTPSTRSGSVMAHLTPPPPFCLRTTVLVPAPRSSGCRVPATGRRQ